MPSQLLPSGIRLGDGLGDFIRFTTDAPYETAANARERSKDRNRDTEARSRRIKSGPGPDARPLRRDRSH
jgi:hypothetical protein